jgi:hypothetical protein
MSLHTSGPWEFWSNGEVTTVKAPDGSRIATICHLTSSGRRPTETAKANGHLIAEAPSLFDALKWINQVLDEMWNDPDRFESRKWSKHAKNLITAQNASFYVLNKASGKHEETSDAPPTKNPYFKASDVYVEKEIVAEKAKKPELFVFFASDGRIGIAWEPDPEAGSAEILKWVPDSMIKEAYRAMLNRDADSSGD